MSEVEAEIAVAGAKFRLTVVALRFGMQEPDVSEQRPPPPRFLDVKWEELENPYKEAVIAIGQALGVEVLEKSLNELIPSVLKESTKTRF